MAEEGGSDGETITLRVKDQTGDEMFFKVRKDIHIYIYISFFFSLY